MRLELFLDFQGSQRSGLAYRAYLVIAVSPNLRLKNPCRKLATPAFLYQFEFRFRAQ